MFEHTSERVIFAADGLTYRECVQAIAGIKECLYAVKIHSLWDINGPEVVAWLKNEGIERVWVDLKLCDIPETVASRAKALTSAGADIITVMAGAGIAAMQAAVEYGPETVLAVTQLTSLSPEEVYVRLGKSIGNAVLFDARLAARAGVHGVVCSPQEVRALRTQPELNRLKLVVPGIRSEGQATHDQKRIGTPGKAIADGASFIVVGRQIRNAEHKRDALRALGQEIAQALVMHQETETANA